MSAESWSIDDVVTWLGEKTNPTIQKKYENTFRSEGVDGAMLLLIDNEALKDDLNITSSVHRKRILGALRKLQADEPPRKKIKSDTGEPPEPVKSEHVRVKLEAETVESGPDAVKSEPDAAKLPAPKEDEDPKEGKEDVEHDDAGVAAGDDDEEEEKEEDEEAAAATAEEGAPVPEDVKSNEVEICFSFDTTGSMYACLGQVKAKIQSLVERLLKDVPHIKIALIAHGDYPDEKSTYLLKKCNFSCDKDVLCNWVQNVGSTHGFDSDEAYEYALREAKSLAWSPTCVRRALVIIGDANPHPVNHANNTHKIDWREEARELAKMDVRIHGVHALGYAHSRNFYQELANISGGLYLELSQFSSIRDLILGVAMAEDNQTTLLRTLEDEVRRGGRMTRSMVRVFDRLLDRAPAAGAVAPAGLEAVEPGRFQVMDVEEKMAIKKYAEAQGLIFKAGKGFYEFTKPEKISLKKEIVLQKKDTGDFFTGQRAREMLGITAATANKKLKPTDFAEYRVFVQSTSYNRALMAGTKFLYEVDTDR